MSFLFSFFDQLLISFHSHNQEPPVINYCHLVNVFVFYIFPTETPLEIPVPQNPVESFGIPTIPITSKSIQVNSISAEYMVNLQYHCKVLTQKLLLVILIEILILKTTMYHKYNFTLKKITPTFETNDEHQAKRYQNALRYSVITKLR
jgi:hypothetical protein